MPGWVVNMQMELAVASRIHKWSVRVREEK